MNWLVMLYKAVIGLIQMGYDTIGQPATILISIATTMLLGIGVMYPVGRVVIVAHFLFYFGSLNTAVVRYRLCSMRGKLDVLYGARDHLRTSSQSLAGINRRIERAQRRLDTAMGWACVYGFGKLVAEFIFEPKRQHGAKTAMRLLVAIFAGMLLAANAMAAEPSAEEKKDIARLQQKAEAARAYLAKPAGGCQAVAVAKELTAASFVVVMIGVVNDANRSGGVGEAEIYRLVDGRKINGLMDHINTQAAREIILSEQGKMRGRLCGYAGHHLFDIWRDVPDTSKTALYRELGVAPEAVERLIFKGTLK